MPDHNSTRVPVAIIGMACLFPEADDLDAYAQNLENGVDAIKDVPANRWEDLYYDPQSKSVDRIYCKRGGFIDSGATFDPIEFGVMPIAAKAAEPDQLLCLKVAANALCDAGYEMDSLPTKNIGVVLGRGGYMTAGINRLIQKVHISEQLVLALRTLMPHVGTHKLEQIKQAFQEQVQSVGPDTAIGLVPNLAASRIANRLDLAGPAYTLDAACASSLLAVDHACNELTSRRCQMVLAGGVHMAHGVSFWSVFCQLGAMSASQQIRPLDRRADGLLIGEGLGMVLLKRLDDAKRDGDRIYAVIRGVGVTSDGREASLMQPGNIGQVQAIERAWVAASLDPKQVGMIEAHGTGTPIGDTTELRSLNRFFGSCAGSKRIGIGSVKSMIGHTMPAAGAASLIKTALALHRGLLLPTLHCEQPHPDLENSCFYPINRVQAWEQEVRLAGVNAFGFGGINVHIVLESFTAPKTTPVVGCRSDESAQTPIRPPDKLLLAAQSPEALLAMLQQTEKVSQSGPSRLCVLDPDAKKVERAQKIVGRKKRWPGRGGMWFAPDGLVTRGGRIAFLFPGVDASFDPHVEDVAQFFGLPVPAEAQGTELEKIGTGVFRLSRFYCRILEMLNIHPQAMAGHSMGEWTGMVESGIVSEEVYSELAQSIQPGSLEVPGVAFAAAGCGKEKATQVISDLEQIVVSNDNCPHQVILCGEEESIQKATERLRAQAVLCQVLPFRSGFHSPVFADYLEPHRQHLAQMQLGAQKIPLWSATTLQPYPAQHAAVCDLVLEHLIKPVRFRELIERMYQDGFRIFVQVGSGSLVGFVDDILHGREHLCLSSYVSERPALEQLAKLATALWAEGVPVDLARLWPAQKKKNTLDHRLTLHLGVPMISLPPDASLGSASTSDGLADTLSQSPDPLLREFGAMQQDLLESQQQVLQALAAQTQAPRHTVEKAKEALPISQPQPVQEEYTLHLSVQNEPALLDHCLFRQPQDWPRVEDRQPVVPMTMSLQLLMDAAQRLRPGQVAVAMRNIQALRWMAVEPPIDVRILVRTQPDQWVRVEIEGYVRGEVLLQNIHPQPPEAKPLKLQAPQEPFCTAQRVYGDRYLFHGPNYQGLVDLGPMDHTGIRGEIETPQGPGSLLDNAGQVFGFWVLATSDTDRMAMPVRIDEIDFYGPEPNPGTRIVCQVWIKEVGELEVACDMELLQDGKLWCRIVGWTDRRFGTDPVLYEAFRMPDQKLLSVIRPGGYALFDAAVHRIPSRDWLSRRYLSQVEVEQMLASGPKRARQWLHGRIVAKDITRHFLWQREFRPIFPIEIQLSHTEEGAPLIHGSFEEDLRISLSHSGDLAVALVAEGKHVGIDIEKIEPRLESFEQVSFTKSERALLPQQDREAWITRFWCAKEAVAKARRTGMAGKPKRFVIKEVANERLLVDGCWVQTAQEGEHIVAWTEVI